MTDNKLHEVYEVLDSAIAGLQDKRREVRRLIKERDGTIPPRPEFPVETSTPQEPTQEPMPEPTPVVSDNLANTIVVTINKIIAQSIGSLSAMCMTKMQKSQVIDLNGCPTDSNINIMGLDFGQVDAIDLNCIQISQIKNKIAQGIMDAVMSVIKSHMDNVSINNMISHAMAATERKITLGSQPQQNTFNLSVTNDNILDIQNIVRDAINQNFDSQVVQNCINDLMQTRKSQCGEDVSMVYRADQFTTAIISCMNEKGVGQNILDYITTELETVEGFDSKKNSRDNSDMFWIFCIIFVILFVIFVMRRSE
jgi:hypothetical protein